MKRLRVSSTAMLAVTSLFAIAALVALAALGPKPRRPGDPVAVGPEPDRMVTASVPPAPPSVVTRREAVAPAPEAKEAVRLTDEAVVRFFDRVVGGHPAEVPTAQHESLAELAAEYEARHRAHLRARGMAVKDYVADKRKRGEVEELPMASLDLRQANEAILERYRAATRPLHAGQQVVVATRGWTTEVIRIDPGECAGLDAIDEEWRSYKTGVSTRVSALLARELDRTDPR